MTSLWRLTAVGVAAIAAVAMPSVAVVYYYLGASNAGAFLYGVGVGAVVFATIALSVALITGRGSPLRMLLGAVVYVGRLGIAAVAIGVPVWTEGWPLLPVFFGFAGVYVVENVAILVMLGRRSGAGNRWRGEDRERRIEV